MTLPAFRDVPLALLHLDHRALMVWKDAPTTDPHAQYLSESLRIRGDIAPEAETPYGLVLLSLAQAIYNDHFVSRRRATSKARALLAHVLAIPDGPVVLVGRRASRSTPTEGRWDRDE